MIPHIDIEAEYSTTRISCLIDVEKDPVDHNYKIVMPAILFYRNKEDMNAGKEYTSIDNPYYIFGEFTRFLEEFLLDKISLIHRKELWNVLDVITTYRQARELLEMLKWIKDYGVQTEI